MKKRPTLLLNKSPYDLVDDLWPNYSMIIPNSMRLTIEAAKKYYELNELNNGCVVECGVWKGGMSVLLARLFSEKKLFLCDSFMGFEPIENSPYSLKAAENTNDPADGKERHHPGNKKVKYNGNEFFWATSEQDVRETLLNFELIPEQHNITIIPGYIRDSLPSRLEEIGDISVLRIDVDAFAATYECLEILYDKVLSGGVIIFDDCLEVEEANNAIIMFEKNRNLKFDFLPFRSLGCYIIKP